MSTVSEELFRRNQDIMQQLAAAVSENTGTLRQVVEVQRMLALDISKQNEMLAHMNEARERAVSTVKSGMDHRAESLKLHIDETTEDLKQHIAGQVERLEFWRKPQVVLALLAMASSSIVSGVLQVISALKGAG